MNSNLSHLSFQASRNRAKEEFLVWLQNEFSKRSLKNPQYSLRAFARDIDLDPSSLSQILAGKRPFSAKTMAKICEKIGCSSEKLALFNLSHGADGQDLFFQLKVDSFKVISDWYHYAILELTFVEGFKSSPAWIAKQLNISVEESAEAIERLLRLKLLLKENGRLMKSSQFLTNQGDVDTSQAHKKLQTQILDKAKEAIVECPQELKDITSMTMAIDPAKLPLAKSLIAKFRRELCVLLEEDKQSRVYHLGIQLYPVSKKGDRS